MDDSLLEEEVGLHQLSPEVLPALAQAVETSISNSSLSTLAGNVLYGDALDRQQLDIVRLQRQLEGAAGGLVVPFLRRLHWARLLGLLTGETLDEWAKQVQEQRQQYRSLRQQQQLTASQLASLDPQRFHPLAATAGNPWSQKQVDEELQEEIWRDIERTYPERDIFNKETTRRSLQRVLFAWAKSNTDVSYKQGMNEILAVLYLACAREALPPQPGEALGNSFSIIFSSEPADIEADAFRLFDSLMTGCCMRAMYLPPQQGAPPAIIGDLRGGPLGGPPVHPRGPPQSALLLRCNRVFSSLLAKADPAVYAHLEGLGVEPQLFLLRWLRLLFCREFHVEDTLLIWDAIFSDGWISADQKTTTGTPAASSAGVATATEGRKAATTIPQQLAAAASEKLPLVDFFAVAMLKFIRQQLLESDLSSCLRRLLKFPPIESVQYLVALSLAVRKGGSPSAAGVAAGAARSTEFCISPPASPNPLSPLRLVQQGPPPLAPSLVVDRPQLQQQPPTPQNRQQLTQQLHQQQEHQGMPMKREDRQTEDYSSRSQDTAEASAQS